MLQYRIGMSISESSAPKRPRVTSCGPGGVPSNLAGFKRSKEYIVESLLTSTDYIPESAEPIGVYNGNENIYLRSDVSKLRSAQNWKSGYSRKIKDDQRPMRIIQKDIGGVSRTLQLFTYDQTEPLEHLVASAEAGIPTNEYGSVELNLIPDNSVLIACNDISLITKVCRGIENLIWCKCQSGWKRRQPVYGGVVVLLEDAPRVTDALHAELAKQEKEAERERDEAAWCIWRVLMERIKAEYFIQTVVENS